MHTNFLARIVQKPERGGPDRVYYAIRSKERPSRTIEWLGLYPIPATPKRIRAACRKHGVRIGRQTVPRNRRPSKEDRSLAADRVRQARAEKRALEKDDRLVQKMLALEPEGPREAIYDPNDLAE